MRNIRINPEELQAKANALRVESERFGECIQAMGSIINSLDESWEGETTEAYKNQFSELKPGFENTKQLIADIGKQIDDAVALAQELDRELASKLGVN